MVLQLSRKSPFLLRYFLLKCSRCKSSLAVLPQKQNFPEKKENFMDESISQIIDVRTPAEFEEDHIPGAVNLPVLSDNERVIVGTMYKGRQFEARKTGAALISRNIAQHIDEYFKTKDSDFSPLIYCWRGGQRSYSMALVLAQIGFPTYVFEGGYKRYRQIVGDDLTILPGRFQYKVISGLTGSGKTKVLQTLSHRGHQILDLEALAKHKGSVLGLWHDEKQPSQKFFDSLLWDALQKLSPERPVWLESESIRIGNIFIPQDFFKKIQTAERFCINLPTEERVKHIIKDYPNWIEHKDELKVIIQKLVKVRGHKQINDWLALIESNQWVEFVRRILLEHYDPSYTLSQRKNNLSDKEAVQINIPNLDDNTLDGIVNVLTDL